jgi:hypothetical protein
MSREREATGFGYTWTFDEGSAVVSIHEGVGCVLGPIVYRDQRVRVKHTNEIGKVATILPPDQKNERTLDVKFSNGNRGFFATAQVDPLNH